MQVFIVYKYTNLKYYDGITREWTQLVKLKHVHT